MPTTDQRELGICAQQQSEEWEVLGSIYPDYVSRDVSSGILKFEIPIELAYPMDVLVTGAGDAESQEYHLSLSSLPPVLLEIALPPAYPLRSAPEIVSFHVSGSWIPRSGRLLEKLQGMWQPGEVVLYAWVEGIHGADFLDSMGIIRDSVLRIPHAAPQLLLPFLTAYESKSQISKFNLASHSCNVCFETVKGSRCLQINCGHVFCRACLRDGWSLYVAEGDTTRVGCLDPQCVKDGQEATEDEVRRVVTEEEVRRWKRLREKKAAERGKPIGRMYPDTHCPQILRLYCVQWFFVKHLCRNRQGQMFKTVLAGKGCERVRRARIRSVHFARELGTGRYLIVRFRSRKSW